MPSKDGDGELVAGGREAYARVRLVEDEAGIGERLDHRRRRPGHHAECRREVAHGNEIALVGQSRLRVVDRLEVVFDGARRQHVRPSLA